VVRSLHLESGFAWEKEPRKLSKTDVWWIVDILIYWVVVTRTMEFWMTFHILGMECHHPNWRTPACFRGVAKKHQADHHGNLAGWIASKIAELKPGRWLKFTQQRGASHHIYCSKWLIPPVIYGISSLIYGIIWVICYTRIRNHLPSGIHIQVGMPSLLFSLGFLQTKWALYSSTRG
jgi:hypothetical protein